MHRRALLRLLAASATAVAGCSHFARNQLRGIDVGGAPFHFIEGGRGAPVILIHGGLQDYRLWAPVMGAFATRNRVIAYSRRNHYPGRTSPDGAPDGAADLHADDLSAFLSALGIVSAHVVAHSAGAHAALFFAHANPSRVRSLTINEPPAAGLLIDAPGGPDVARGLSNALTPARDAFRAGRLEDGMRLFAEAVGGPGEYERRGEDERARMRDNVAAHIADAITTRPRPVFTSAMARELGVRTLLTSGTRSPEFFQRVCDQLEACVPRMVRERIEGASHTIPSEAPDAFARAALTFIHTPARSRRMARRLGRPRRV